VREKEVAEPGGRKEVNIISLATHCKQGVVHCAGV
jgi:hypothetical protein